MPPDVWKAYGLPHMLCCLGCALNSPGITHEMRKHFPGKSETCLGRFIATSKCGDTSSAPACYGAKLPDTSTTKCVEVSA